ncbi:MAG: hypothetical protein LCH61_18045 [Proteobacteria bacterium]|nr:hypothetical protein [Pseudomonadota bacterium]
MNAYVLIMIVQMFGGTQPTQQVVGEFPSIEQCRKAARTSEVVRSVNENVGPKPRIDYVCVERSKL